MVALAVPTASAAQESWLGGVPRYADGVARPPPRCGVCGEAMLFVAQIDAPVHGPRALHVFGCEPCSGDDRAWAARRTQRTEAAAAAPPPPPPPTPAANANAWAAASDWGDDDADGADDAALEAALRAHEAGASAAATPARASPAAAAAAPPPPADAALAAAFPRRGLAWVEEPGGASAAAADSDDEGDGAALGDDDAMLARAARYLDVSDDGVDAASKAALAATLARGATAAAAPPPVPPGDDDDGYERADGFRSRVFANRLARKPDQVARYDYGGAPLWPADTPVPPPRTCACGAERKFELQLLPTLVYVLKAQALDFTTVAIFSCADSCDASTDEVAVVRAAPALQAGRNAKL